MYFCFRKKDLFHPFPSRKVFKKLKASQIVYINIQWLTALFQMFHDQSSLALGKCGLISENKNNDEMMIFFCELNFS